METSIQRTHRGMPQSPFGAAAVLLTFAAALLAATTAAARDTELPQSVIDAAQKEGTVTVYTGSRDFTATVAAFSKKYGIKNVVVALGGTANQQRFQAEADSKRVQADLFTTTDVDFLIENPKYFRPIANDTVPNAAGFAAPWRIANGITWDALPLGIMYNTKMIPTGTEPKTYTDLLKPEYKGKICVNDPRGSNGARGFTKTIVKAHGIAYLEKLAAQNVRIIPGNTSPGAQAVAAGDCGIGVPQFSGSTLKNLQAKGAPIEWKPVLGPLIQNNEMIALVEGSPHPNAARLLANFAISEEGTKLRCGGASVAMASDPDGKLGCYVAVNPEPLDFSTDAAEFAKFLDILGVK